jgi:diguanylate cyclase (GGDEF)-like protein
MKLRNKISVIVLVIWALMATFFYYGSHRVILNSYLKLEKHEIINDIDRTEEALNQLIDAVQLSVKDWSIWDETYRFVQDKNHAFIKSTLALSSFQSIDIDMILFYDTNGKLIHSAAVNSDRTKQVPVPDGLLDVLEPKGIILHQLDINSSSQGMISIPSGILLIASHSIITSESTGPVRGTLVMAKYLTNAVMKKIEKISGTDAALFRLPQTINQKELSPIYKKLITGHDTEVITNENQISAYRMLTDINGKKVAILKIESPRKIYQIGSETIRYSNIIVIFYSIIITIILWLLLQFLIVKRIEKLGRNVKATDANKKSFHHALSNLADEVSSVERLFHRATHDPLTGLANRSSLYESFNRLIAGLDESSEKIVVIYIDLDHFKRINDTLGRDVGDQLLLVTAKRLSATLRDEDIAARLGGDEFVIVLTDVKKDEIESVTNRIFKAVNRAFKHDNHEIYVSCSMGVCVYPEDGTTIETLIKKADMALYHAKENGRNHYQFYSESLHQSINETYRKEIELQNAIDAKQLCLYYQPIYNLRTKQIVSLEALIRWNHPTKGILGASEVIPLAESTDLIYPIGEWVLKTACMQVKEWQNKGLPVVPVAVNISSAQMKQSSISEIVIDALHASSLDSKLLQIEITETGFIDLNPKLLKDLEGLRASGIKLTIDDFGTGYAGLGYLKSLPVYKLKIDQSFIRDIQTDPDDKAITLAIIAIAHQLNLEVTAEGVENIEQYNFMCYHQVDEVQGFFLSKPLSAEDCERLLSGDDPLPDLENK